MRNRSFISGAILLLVVSAALSVVRAQDASTAASPDQAARSFAVNLLRAVNTAENAYRYNHNGAYAPWETLVTSPEFMTKGLPWASKMDPRFATVHFSSGPNILPGWALRLDVTSSGYDLLLEDAADKASGYAAETDERGLIRECWTIR